MWRAKTAGPVAALAYAPDGRMLYTLDGSGAVTAWDVAAHAGRKLFAVAAGSVGLGSRVAVSPDGRYVLATDDELIAVWDLAAGGPRPPIDCRDGEISYPCFAAGGTKLYAVGVAANWLTLWDWPDRKQLDVPEKLAEAADFPIGAAVNAAGTRLAVDCSGRGVLVWDLEKGRELLTVDLGDGDDFEELAMAFSPDGRWFAVGFGSTLRVYDLSRRRLLHEIPVGRQVLRSVAVHPTGKLVAAGGGGTTVGFWDVAAGQKVAEFDPKIGNVPALAFSPDGATIAAGGSRKAFAVWDVDV